MRREKWQFVGRVTAFGYEYWVWELVAQPVRPWHYVGKTYVVRAP